MVGIPQERWATRQPSGAATRARHGRSATRCRAGRGGECASEFTLRRVHDEKYWRIPSLDYAIAHEEDEKRPSRRLPASALGSRHVRYLLDGTMLKNLLVALDGSACAERAFDLALALAKAESSVITVCSVADPRPTFGVGPPTMIENELLQIELHARNIVDEALAKAREVGISTTGTVLEGVPPFEIVRYAKEVGAGAIVMGTHGRSGLKHFFMGSVAEGVLRASEIPVITVRMETTLAPLTAEAVL